MLVEFEQNCMVQTKRNFELDDKKPSFLYPFLTKSCAILEHVSEAEIIV